MTGSWRSPRVNAFAPEGSAGTVITWEDPKTVESGPIPFLIVQEMKLGPRVLLEQRMKVNGACLGPLLAEPRFPFPHSAFFSRRRLYMVNV